MKRVRNISTPELQIDEKIRILTSRLRKLEKIKLANVDNQQYAKAAAVRDEIYKLNDEVTTLSTFNSLKLINNNENRCLPKERMQFPLYYNRTTGYLTDSRRNNIAKRFTRASHDDMILLTYLANQAIKNMGDKK